MILTGARVPASYLREAGLITTVVPAGKALEAARELAASVAANAPLAVAASKRVVVQSAGWSPDEEWARQGQIIGAVFGSADAMEGAAAFAEKRPPVWRGE